MPPGRVNAQVSGGVNIFTTVPELVCVGDSFTLDGVASTDWEDFPGDIPLAPLQVTTVEISALHGKVTPEVITQSNDGYYFSFAYMATSEGDEVITLTLNGGIATHEESFKVRKSCSYDAFLLTYINLAITTGDPEFRSFTTVTGTGTMKHLMGEQYMQGDGTWHLEENILSKPPDCVQWYIPPLIASGPFELDGKLADEGDTVDVILAFQPSGKPSYHGKSVCVDADGNELEGWSMAVGGNPELASKIQATFPSDGGTQEVEIIGEGMNMVQSQADLQYAAQLTLIPR